MLNKEMVYTWLKGSFVLNSGFYAGRGPNKDDLGTRHLELFYEGIKKDVGNEAAKNFVRFVNKLDDLSASAFIVAFEQFIARNCTVVAIKQRKEDGNRLDARGGHLQAQGMAVIMNAFAGRRQSFDEIRSSSYEIKAAFIQKHQKEIPAEERPPIASVHDASGIWRDGNPQD